MQIDIETIRLKLDQLNNQGKVDVIFNEPLHEEYITQFENLHNVNLPEGYKQFLCEIGNGGTGPNYGLLSLEDSLIDFKLDQKPLIDISSDFKYESAWNAPWIKSFDWDNDRPELDVVNQYMDVSHISGCLQVSHYGHGCTNLLVIKGKSKGQIWFDGRADYGGLTPEENSQGHIYSFLEWYSLWLDEKIRLSSD